MMVRQTDPWIFPKGTSFSKQSSWMTLSRNVASSMWEDHPIIGSGDTPCSDKLCAMEQPVLIINPTLSMVKPHFCFFSNKPCMEKGGWDWCPYYWGLFHITKTNICWRWNIPKRWVVSSWDIYHPLWMAPQKTDGVYRDRWDIEKEFLFHKHVIGRSASGITRLGKEWSRFRFFRSMGQIGGWYRFMNSQQVDSSTIHRLYSWL